MGFWDYVKTGINAVAPVTLGFPGLSSSDVSGAFGLGSGDPTNPDRDALRALAAQQGTAGYQGLQNYRDDRTGQQATQDYFRDQMMGKGSLSSEMLRQGLQQNVAGQVAAAQGGPPQDAAMRARNAALNAARAGAGFAGQQAIAGIQEGAEGARSLSQMQMAQSGQDLQYGLGGYGLANSAYGGALGNPQKTWGSMLGGALGGLSAGAAGMIGKGA